MSQNLLKSPMMVLPRFITLMMLLVSNLIVAHTMTNPTLIVDKFISLNHFQNFDVKCILSDIDGTLISDKHIPSVKTMASIEIIKNMGIPFFIATGRSRKSMSMVTGSAFIDLFGGDVNKISGVFSQGLEVYGRNGELIHEQFLDDEVIEQSVLFSKTHGLGLIALAGDRIFCDHHSAQTDKLLSYGEPLPELYPEGIINLNKLLDAPKINKIILLEEESILQSIRGALESLFLNVATITHSVAGMLEILPFGASKGAGVRKLLEHYDLPVNRTVAFGDGENDLEMLQLVRLGVAVQNARPLLKAVAHATTHSNNDDGVAHVLDMIASVVMKPVVVPVV